MARTTYTVKASDTLPNVARKFYGAANQQESIIKSNRYLQFRRDSGNSDLNGTPNLFEGDVLTIITDNPTTSPPNTSNKEELSVFLDGSQVSLPDSTILELHYDACCNKFNSIFPWDSSNALDRAWFGDPRNLAEVVMYSGDLQIFGGKGTKSKNVNPSDESSMLFNAMTYTYTLLKSNLPSMSYPVEREGETLTQIVEWVNDIFGFRTDVLSSDTDIFKKVSAKKSSLVFQWLSNLASTRGRVLSATLDGYGLEIKNPLDIQESVGDFVEGEAGFNPPEFEFDTTKLHNTYTASTRRARRAKITVGYRDDSFTEQSYKYIDLQGTAKVDQQTALEYNARKAYRDFFQTTFDPGGTLLNPQGDLWLPGQYITLTAPSSRIYEPLVFLISKVGYRLNADNLGVDLSIVPPWVYGGGNSSQADDLTMWDNL